MFSTSQGLQFGSLHPLLSDYGGVSLITPCLGFPFGKMEIIVPTSQGCCEN